MLVTFFTELKAAKGAVKQAVTYPNPTFGYEADTVATGPAGYQGAFVEQVIKTGNKLQLAGRSRPWTSSTPSSSKSIVSNT